MLPLLLDALAAHRVTRLIQRDTLPPLPEVRHALTSGQHRDHPAVELLYCPWCLSVHVAAGIGVARAVAPRTWDRIARVLAISTVVGLISEREHG